MSNLGPSDDKFGTFWGGGPRTPLVPFLVALMGVGLNLMNFNNVNHEVPGGQLESGNVSGRNPHQKTR